MRTTVGIWLVRLPQIIQLSTDFTWRINYIQCYVPLKLFGMNKERKQEMIDHMFKSARGYGMAEGNGIQSKFRNDGTYMQNKTGGTVEGGKKAFEKCMNAIPSELFEDFVYTLYRIADKSGADGFDY